ncbi:transposase [Kitasatospora sp. MAP5-34]|nr:transposase [Kitasatospora sp. MAP5-34]
MADAHHLLELAWGDGGYTGGLIEHCFTASALVLVIVKRTDGQKGFVMLPKLWIVGRFCAHLMRTRRLGARLGRRISSAEAMVHWSMTLLMTRRPTRSRPPRA